MLSELNFLDWVLIILSVFRISEMLVNEDGFLSLTFAIRLFGNKIKTNDKIEISKFHIWKTSLVKGSEIVQLIPTNHLGKLLQCIWCTSVWVGLLLPLAYIYTKDTLFVFVFVGLSLSSLTIFLDKLTD